MHADARLLFSLSNRPLPIFTIRGLRSGRMIHMNYKGMKENRPLTTSRKKRSSAGAALIHRDQIAIGPHPIGAALPDAASVSHRVGRECGLSRLLEDAQDGAADRGDDHNGDASKNKAAHVEPPGGQWRERSSPEKVSNRR
jgi:hypothetical protein